MLGFLPSSEPNNQSMKCLLSHSAQSPVFTLYPFFFPPVFLGTDEKSEPAKGLKPKAGPTGSNKFDKFLFPLFSPSAKGFSCHTTHPAFLESTSNVHVPQWRAQNLGGTVTISINNKIPIVAIIMLSAMSNMFCKKMPKEAARVCWRWL